MARFLHGLARVTLTIWAGGMWVVGYLAVPVLFNALPDRMLAGMLAGKMFAAMAWVGMLCAVYLLAYGYWQFGGKMRAQKIFWAIGAMLLLTVLGQFGLQPLMAELKAQALPLDVMHSEFYPRFKMLHGVASIIYLIQSLLAAILVLKFATPARSISAA